MPSRRWISGICSVMIPNIHRRYPEARFHLICLIYNGLRGMLAAEALRCEILCPLTAHIVGPAATHRRVHL